MWTTLRENLRTRLPAAHIVADTESRMVPSNTKLNVKEYPFRLAVACSFRLEKGECTRSEWAEFTSINAFWNWTIQHTCARRPTWLWFHNAGWDLTCLQFWRQLETRRFLLEKPSDNPPGENDGSEKTTSKVGALVTRDPPTFVACWTHHGHKLVICDTFNWWQHSLAELGKMVDLPKLPQPDMDASDECWLPYCYRDVEITKRVVLETLQIVKRNDLGNFRYTPAAQALAAFRHKYRTHRICFHHDEELTEFERKSYYGAQQRVYFRGRVASPNFWELTSNGQEKQGTPTDLCAPVRQLDCNACYAFVMSGKPYPIRYLRIEAGIEPAAARLALGSYAGCASVRLRTRDNPYPIRQGLAVHWMIGEFDTCLPGPELIQALDRGHVQRIYQLRLYEQAPIFTAFVEGMTALENQYSRDTEPFRRQVIKQIRNGLYGKFGQYGRGWEVVPGEVWPEAWGQYAWPIKGNPKPETRRSIAHSVQRLVNTPIAPWTFPLISAYVASYARLHMQRLVSLAGLFGCYYLDADSIHVSQDGFERLHKANMIHDTEPGRLRVVDCANSAVYSAPKSYTLGDKVVCAGLDRSARNWENGTYEADRFLHLPEMLTATPPNAPQVKIVRLGLPVHSLGATPTVSGWTSPLECRLEAPGQHA